MKHAGLGLILLTLIAQFSFADEPPEPAATHKIVSSTSTCWAVTDASKHVTTAYRNAQKGKPVALWSAPGWFRVADLSGDCKYLVTGYDGGNLLPVNADGELVMLTFFRDGKVIRRIRLKELICDVSRLERTHSHLAWGNYLGAEDVYFYRIETKDRGEIVFDMRTGKTSNRPSLACDAPEAHP